MPERNVDDLFDEEFGDLLTGVEENKSVSINDIPETKEPVVEVPVSVSVNKNESSSTTSHPTTSYSSADDGFVAFGSKVSSVPIPRFKASKDTKARIAVLSKQVLTLKTHYTKETGSFVCLEDKCCELEGLPRVRYLVPIVQYSTNKAGAIVGQDLELKVLSLGAETYDALVDAISFSGRSVQDVDVICTCSDEQYQKLSFAADASKGAQWRAFPSAKAIIEKYKNNKSKLYMAVARRISLDTYLTKKGFMRTSAPTMGTVDNIEDLLDE